MPNTSATGGYLTPSVITPELSDEPLRVFLQGLVSGVTGLAPQLVRPRWQPEPVGRPQQNVTWAAVGVGKRTPDYFDFSQHQAGIGDVKYRNEILEIAVSIYGPQAESTAQLLSFGLQVAQNLEQLALNRYGLVDVSEALTIGELVNELWVERVDLTVRLRHAQIYTYPILEILSVQGKVATESVTDNFTSFHSSTPFPVFGWGLATTAVSGWGAGHWG